MFDLAEIRTELHDVLRTINGGELNVYSWPDAQPEYPNVMMSWPDEIDYHFAHARSVSILTVTLTCSVAYSDLEEATRMLDQYANPDGDRSLLATLEDADGGTAWSNLTVDRAANWRRLNDVDGLAFDVVLTIHA